MMKLVSMKMKKSESNTALAMPAEAPEYPYGLSLTLDTSALDKLGLDVTELEVGSKKMIMAEATVTAISSNESQGGTPQQSVSLQITDLACEEMDTDSTEDKIYGKA
jgi:hypothetical protein